MHVLTLDAQIDVLICTPTILSQYHPSQYPRLKVIATAGEPTTQVYEKGLLPCVKGIY